MSRILIVEDDEDIAELERDYLVASGFDTALAADGRKGLSLALGGGFDLVILDLMLPGEDGLSVCNDYVTKPFSPSVLVARVKACLASAERASSAVAAAAETNETQADDLVFGDVRICPTSHTVSVAGSEVTLTNREYELLLFLAQRPDTVFSRQALYERVWGEDAVGDGATVTVHVNRLREKLEHDPAHPALIQTVRGAGYILRSEAGK